MWPANPAGTWRQAMNHLWPFHSVFVKGFLGSIVCLNCTDILHSEIQEGELENKEKKSKSLNLWLANKASFHILHLLERSKQNSVIPPSFWSHIDKVYLAWLELLAQHKSLWTRCHLLALECTEVQQRPCCQAAVVRLWVSCSTHRGWLLPRIWGAGSRPRTCSQEQGCRFTCF